VRSGAVERNLDSRWWRTAGLKETSKFRLHFLRMCACAGQLASIELVYRPDSRFISGLAARLGLLRVEAVQSSYCTCVHASLMLVS